MDLPKSKCSSRLFSEIANGMKTFDTEFGIPSTETKYTNSFKIKNKILWTKKKSTHFPIPKYKAKAISINLTFEKACPSLTKSSMSTFYESGPNCLPFLIWTPRRLKCEWIRTNDSSLDMYAEQLRQKLNLSWENNQTICRNTKQNWALS